MPRLRNEVTGAVLSVSDSIAARLGGVWVPADDAKPEPKRASKSRKADEDK